MNTSMRNNPEERKLDELKRVKLLEAAVKASRELYTASRIMSEGNWGEEDHFDFQMAAAQMHERLKELDQHMKHTSLA